MSLESLDEGLPQAEPAKLEQVQVMIKEKRVKTAFDRLGVTDNWDEDVRSRMVHEGTAKLESELTALVAHYGLQVRSPDLGVYVITGGTLDFQTFKTALESLGPNYTYTWIS